MAGKTTRAARPTHIELHSLTSSGLRLDTGQPLDRGQAKNGQGVTTPVDAGQGAGPGVLAYEKGYQAGIALLKQKLKQQQVSGF